MVNYLVEQTLGPWFADAKAACGYPRPDEGAPTATAAAAYAERLKTIRIVDTGRGPQIEGSRITVMDVFYYLRRGYDFDFIHRAMPSLTP